MSSILWLVVIFAVVAVNVVAHKFIKIHLYFIWLVAFVRLPQHHNYHFLLPVLLTTRAKTDKGAADLMLPSTFRLQSASTRHYKAAIVVVVVTIPF